jgi:hypothetical protein
MLRKPRPLDDHAIGIRFRFLSRADTFRGPRKLSPDLTLSASWRILTVPNVRSEVTSRWTFAPSYFGVLRWDNPLVLISIEVGYRLGPNRVDEPIGGFTLIRLSQQRLIDLFDGHHLWH